MRVTKTSVEDAQVSRVSLLSQSTRKLGDVVGRNLPMFNKRDIRVRHSKKIAMRTRSATPRSRPGTISQETGWCEVVWQSACPILNDSDEPAPALVHGKFCWAVGGSARGGDGDRHRSRRESRRHIRRYLRVRNHRERRRRHRAKFHRCPGVLSGCSGA
jgi:hypothetical protein